MADIVEVLQHWYAGRSKTDVAASLGVDRGTIRKHVTPAETAGMTPGGTPVSRAEWSALAADWFPELIDAKARSLTFGEINVHRDKIVMMLATNRPATVWQRLRDEHGLAVGLTSFRRYVWLEFPDEVTADNATVLRPDVEPGSEAQIDYGYLGLWPDPVSGRSRKLNAFVMVLAMSRRMFVRPVLSMDQTEWSDAHVAAFKYFGGAPTRWVYENVPRNIFVILWPGPLCVGPWCAVRDHGGARVRRRARGHITVRWAQGCFPSSIFREEVAHVGVVLHQASDRRSFSCVMDRCGDRGLCRLVGRARLRAQDGVAARAAPLRVR